MSILQKIQNLHKIQNEIKNRKFIKHTAVTKLRCLDHKLFLDVLLSSRNWVKSKNKPSINSIEKLARHLYMKHEGFNFKTFFISFYLRGRIIGCSAWATTSYTPDLEIKILKA